jgi:hypothetical protein
MRRLQQMPASTVSGHSFDESLELCGPGADRVRLDVGIIPVYQLVVQLTRGREPGGPFYGIDPGKIGMISTF